MTEPARESAPPCSPAELRQALAAKLTALGLNARQVRERLHAATGLTDLQLMTLTTAAQVRAAFRRAGQLSDPHAGEIAALVKAARAPAKPTPPPPEPEQPLRATGVQGGRTYAAVFERFAPYWADHLRHSHAFILEGARKAPRPDRVTVLGVSEARDIPLPALAQTFATVKLVDIDEASLHRAADSLRRNDPDGRSADHVCCYAEDLTGGRLDRLVREGCRLIGAADSAQAALRALGQLYSGYDPDVSGEALDHLRASYVVSSGVASQLPGLVIHALGDAFVRRFPRLSADPAAQAEYAAACVTLHTRLAAHHAETLRALAGEDGLIYWSDTVAEAPDLRKMTPPQKQALLQAVCTLVGSADWSAPLDADVRAALRDSREPSATAALLMTLLKADRLPVAKTLELIAHLLEQARRINAAARDVIIPGGLAAFFPDRLAPDGPPRSWDWVVHPLNLSALHVEAFHLRPSSSGRTG